MTRSALEGLARPLIARAFDVCEDAMRVAGIRPTQLDNVVLVGGSTRVPKVVQVVKDLFGGKEPELDVRHPTEREVGDVREDRVATAREVFLSLDVFADAGLEARVGVAEPTEQGARRRVSLHP